MYAKRLVERRQALGRSIGHGAMRPRSGLTTSSLVRAYQTEVERQRLMVRKSTLVQQRLFFIYGALRQMFEDENFANVLKLEKLDSLPKYLADRLTGLGAGR